MKIVDITACIRVTKENDMYGMEYYIDIGSKVKITFTDGKTLVGYVQRIAVSFTHFRAHKTDSLLVCRLLLEKKKKNKSRNSNIQ